MRGRLAIGLGDRYHMRLVFNELNMKAKLFSLGFRFRTNGIKAVSILASAGWLFHSNRGPCKWVALWEVWTETKGLTVPPSFLVVRCLRPLPLLQLNFPMWGVELSMSTHPQGYVYGTHFFCLTGLLSRDFLSASVILWDCRKHSSFKTCVKKISNQRFCDAP